MESRESTTGFQQYWLILKRRWLPASIVFGSVFALTALGLLLRKPVYIAEGKLLFTKTSPTSSLTGLGTQIGQLDPLQYQNTPLDTEAEVMRSLPITTKTIAQLNLRDERGKPLKLKQFLKQVNVTNLTGTDVLQVTYKDKNAQKAAAVVNTLMGIYLQNNVTANRTATVAAREFVENQLPKTKETMRQAEMALRAFQEENKVVALDEEKRSAVDLISDLQRQINTAQTQLADAKAQSTQLQNEIGKNLQQAGTATAVSQVSGVQDLLKEVQQVESQLATERGRFQEDHPTILNLKNKKADLERLLQQRVGSVVAGRVQQTSGNLQTSQYEQTLTQDFAKSEARRLGLASQLAALADVQASYRQRLNVIPKLEQKQRELVRDLEAAQSTYSLLVQKFQEMRIAENQNVGNARIIAGAIPPEEPVASRKLSILAALFLACCAAGTTVYVLEAKDKSIKTVEEAKRAFGFTLLGMIPAVKKGEKTTRKHDLERSIPEIVVKASPRSSVSAAYRMLQANMKFLTDKELKVVVVTSSVPKEGKSTVSANLALTMAALGRKVLLVDADMHRPFQHHIWNLPNQHGLSNILVGQAELKTTIKQVTSNLDVLTSGVMPPNPMALLDSQRMASLMSMFANTYDCTIIDTPSLSVEAEATILGKMADGILLVVRPGVVDAANAALAKQFLQQSNQNVLGQVINGVMPENEPYSYYYFSQDYYARETEKVKS